MSDSRDSPKKALPAHVVEQAQRGDRQAMQLVLESNYDFVRRMMTRLLGPDTDLEDLVQTVLMRIVTSLPTARLESALTTWIGGICVHVARDHLRRRKVRSVVVPSEECGVGEGQPAAGDDVHRAATARQRLSRCVGALDGLSAEQRTAFVLRAIEGYSVAEVAAMMGAAHSTTRLRLYYARKNLARAMAAYDDSAPEPSQEGEPS